MRLIPNFSVALILSYLCVMPLAVAENGSSEVASPETPSILVESFNIRYNNWKDWSNAWPQRQQLVLKQLQQTQPDVVGMQEVLASQLDWLKEQLPNYAFIGVGRDDGARGGEFVPLLYNTQALNMLGSGYFWLSETPDVAGSVGWSAKHPRIVTWGEFSHGNRTFFVFNAHFSHMSDLARRKSAEFLVNHIPTIAGDNPVILLGDFNTLDSEPAYATITAKTGLMFVDTGLTDGHSPAHTFNDFGKSASKRIDYIFISEGLTSSNYATYQIRDGKRYISDHYPISVRVSLD